MERGVFTAEEIDSILESMEITGRTAITRYGSGHINDTFKVDTISGESYILQRVNTTIFDPPSQELLKRVLLRVTSFLKSKGVTTIDFIGYNAPWRLYRFYGGCTVNEVVSSPRQAYDIGRAFAKFHDDLSDFPAPRLEEVLPKFHDTPDRIKALDEAVRNDAAGRASSVARELEFVEKRRLEAGRIVSLMAEGVIPERVIHNDSKINNVLVMPDSSAVIIDLDTVMPGSALSDFGDMVRTSTAAAAEDEADLTKVFSKKDYFEALARGYIERAAFLTRAEIDNLVFAGRLSTFEVGVRFLTDYINGDVYFHTAYPDHNLIRARNQFRMVESLEENADAYEKIVSELSARMSHIK